MDKTFTIECTMDEKWIPEFYSFLITMQYWGHKGHSQMLGFYSDGDGDFCPEFKFSNKDECYIVSTKYDMYHNLEYFDVE